MLPTVILFDPKQFLYPVGFAERYVGTLEFSVKMWDENISFAKQAAKIKKLPLHKNRGNRGLQSTLTIQKWLTESSIRNFDFTL